MAVTRYSTNVDLRDLNTSHSLAVLSVPPGSRVLDLGTADGSVARALRERGCSVWGVEQDTRAAAEAAKVCEHVIIGDLESPDVWRQLDRQTFDVVLALDVLEHLRDPDQALSRARKCLSNSGLAIVSLPNITHAAVCASLLAGKFQYDELGLLDRSHLRFFDRESAERLLSQAGFEIIERLRVRRSIHETEIPINVDEVSRELIDAIERGPNATTYQFVLVGRPAATAQQTPTGVMLSERLQQENEQLRGVITEGKAYAEHLARELDALRNVIKDEEARIRELEAQCASMLESQVTLRNEFERQIAEERSSHSQSQFELRNELERRMAELNQRHLEVRHAKADLAIKDAYIHQLRAEVLQMEGEVRDARAEIAAKAVDTHRLRAELLQMEAEVREAKSQTQRLRAEFVELEANVQALAAYSSSAGFRLVEWFVVRLKAVPVLHDALRAVVRKIAPRR